MLKFFRSFRVVLGDTGLFRWATLGWERLEVIISALKSGQNVSPYANRHNLVQTLTF